MAAVEVDGSYGEGGGQILRTAAALSIALARPIHVTRIRAGRSPPGLRQQHASVLEILQKVSGGELDGCSVGSPEITFRPGKVRGGSLFFDLKTAASITLVLQAVVPAVSLSGVNLTLDLVGGTDVPWSPTFDYFATVAAEAFARVGLNFRLEATERGYYPRGGGRARATISAAGSLNGVSLLGPEGRTGVSVVSRCGDLPDHIAKRQLESAVRTLRAGGADVEETTFTKVTSVSPGSSILVHQVSENRVMGSDGVGAKGKPAEVVGAEAAESFLRTAASGASVDYHLADMLAPILSLAGAVSRLRIPGPTPHLETSLHVARLFTGCSHTIEEEGASSTLTVVPGRAE